MTCLITILLLLHFLPNLLLLLNYNLAIFLVSSRRFIWHLKLIFQFWCIFSDKTNLYISSTFTKRHETSICSSWMQCTLLMNKIITLLLLHFLPNLLLLLNYNLANFLCLIETIHLIYKTHFFNFGSYSLAKLTFTFFQHSLKDIGLAFVPCTTLMKKD